MSGPSVTVLLTTYDHARWIAQAVESVLAQRATFPVELVVLEDCSTDGTRELVRELAAREPGRIRLVLNERNENSNRAFMAAYHAGRSRYVALLDGDDYWTTPEKLQRQVEALEARPAATLCFHDAWTLREKDGTLGGFMGEGALSPFTLERLFGENFVPGCSPMLRRSAVPALPGWLEGCRFPDWALWILLARRGPLLFLAERMGVWRLHDRGFWSGLSPAAQLEAAIAFAEQLNGHLAFEHDAELRRAVQGWRATLAGWRGAASLAAAP